ncbi:MAG: hypothetical protein HLUCCA04_12110 [Oceanicaulis sp. HLUCCA04]|nr:MAG: hypothetical protein HLUCCA04_12110 [Oceanicaulis sp. HLUCCA04]
MVESSDELLPLNERVENLKKLVERAYIFYSCWWLYEGAETRGGMLNGMQEHSEFYRFDSHAHFCSMIVHCYALMDKPRSATNLSKIAKEIKLPCDLTPINATHKKVAVIRNNAIGHRSRQLSYNNSFERAGVTASEIKNYILGCHHIISEICKHGHVGMRPPQLNDLPAQQLEALITGKADTSQDWISSPISGE